jgi:GDP-L-fucose synthase
MTAPPPLDRSARVYVAGHRGLVGSALTRHLRATGFEDVVGVPRSELDLRDRDAVMRHFERTRPRVVVDAAARVGGILANDTYPSDFLSENLRIQVNLLDAAVESGVERFLFLGSSCIYPRLAPQPIHEDSLLTGPLEPTNDAYAIAKIAGIMHIRSVRKQFGLPFISAMPTNLYGPGDNYDPQSSHVLAALLRRYHAAKQAGTREVTNWGSGTVRREFMHVDDLAEACVFLLEHYDSPDPINVGTGEDVSIRELAVLVAEVVGYTGAVGWDTSKPDGTPRKLLDVSRLADLGWRARTGLREGVTRTYADYAQAAGDSSRQGVPI